MAWTQSDLDKLNAAIASGRLRVQFGDRRIEYRSVDEMLRARLLMIQEINQTSKTTRVSPVYSKDVQ